MPAVLAATLWQRNVDILQHIQSDHRSGASSKRFLNLMIQFYLNNVINLHQLTSHSRTTCPKTQRSYLDHRLHWYHFNPCITSGTKQNYLQIEHTFLPSNSTYTTMTESAAHAQVLLKSTNQENFSA